ncbi:hypothetical protein [Acidovorax sp. A1169]|uniref:hypothetical protein n=1 Tax=Acidovorax sp. A1169 TaxID=3059524 RepID=UPI002737A45F|nr:hypothetical protein [Acidovorax sp. A1169]MDP4073304.1 hypothetical protein [Acidovorax sp. A1169]
MKNIALAAAMLLALHAPHLAAQSSCSSDGVPRPVALFERFVSADCDSCWADKATPAPKAPGTLVLDWIVPGTQGDDAPLSAAATRDALARLAALGRTAPTATDVNTAPVQGVKGSRLRVSHGPAFNDYLGASIAFSPVPTRGAPPAARPDAGGFYLLLVESIPAGAEGSPVARHLVRNVYQRSLDNPQTLSKGERSGWRDSRPIYIPEGAKTDRLRLVGWVQDQDGRIIDAAQSRCTP